jgi:2-polyprenyl-6-methoxyphenol hydroxylase-like FAD-dependent oxidoreductase
MNRAQPAAQRRRAVVVGAGISGLLAACVIAEDFHEVIVVERDTLPDTPEFRAGVPQARHVHNLLVHGKRIVDDLFPGLEHDLAKAGALRFEWPADFLWLSPVGWGRRDHSNLVTVACSRELLE